MTSTVKTIAMAGTIYVLFTALTFMPAKASEPTVLYDATGNAVVAYLTCAASASPVVLYTSARKPIAAYLDCDPSETNVIIVKDHKGPIEQVITNDRAQDRRTTRRVIRRHDD